MTQTLPLSLTLGPANTGKLIGYTVLNLDRTEYAAFALATESAVAGTYYADGGYSAPDAGGYLVVSESDGGNPAVLTAMVEAAVDPAANVVKLAGQATPVDNLVLALGNTDGIVAHPQGIADALKLAPTTGAPAAGSVNKHLDDLLTYGGGSGTGTYTDTIKDGTNPLDGVCVQLSTDPTGTNRVYEAFTNASGVFAMNPDPGTYYRWLDLAGYSFTQGAAVVVT